MNKKARLIAFYLPQFYPIPENDEWWGKDFTEWTNVKKAKPLFSGHNQPVIPGELGYYDLRDVETRKKQAQLAKQYGIEGFCYWHYWFGNGKRILERVFQEVLNSGNPNFPFCLGWANETWSGIWHGAPDRILIEQKYLGEEDYKYHFYEVLEAFKDHRYIRINDKPIFLIFKPKLIPDAKKFANLWNKLAIKEGLKGVYFISILQDQPIFDPNLFGHNAITICNQTKISQNDISYNENVKTYFFENIMKNFIEDVPENIKYFPCIIPNWDNTPRCGLNGIVLQNSTPDLFKKQIIQALDKIKNSANDEKIIFIKSWNEWAEGNYLEPDQKHGRAYLEVIKNEIFK